jgi:hypothetical protein
MDGPTRCVIEICADAFDSYVPYDSIGNITGRRPCVYNVETKASKSDVNIGPLYIIVAE